MSKKKKAEKVEAATIAPFADPNEFLEAKFRECLENVRMSSLAAGAIAMCHVIQDKATAEGKSAEERLADIIEFCETSLKKKEEEL